MARLISLKDAAARKGCSRKTMYRACENGKLNSEFEPVTGEYRVYDDEKLAQWQPGDRGKQPEPPQA
jgi:predicted site-specific integrase-resolvase